MLSIADNLSLSTFFMPCNSNRAAFNDSIEPSRIFAIKSPRAPNSIAIASIVSLAFIWLISITFCDSSLSIRAASFNAATRSRIGKFASAAISRASCNFRLASAVAIAEFFCASSKSSNASVISPNLCAVCSVVTPNADNAPINPPVMFSINQTKPSINGVKIPVMNVLKTPDNVPNAFPNESETPSICLNFWNNATTNPASNAKTPIIGFAFKILNACVNAPTPWDAWPNAGDNAPNSPFSLPNEFPASFVCVDAPFNASWVLPIFSAEFPVSTCNCAFIFMSAISKFYL